MHTVAALIRWNLVNVLNKIKCLLFYQLYVFMCMWHAVNKCQCVCVCEIHRVQGVYVSKVNRLQCVCEINKLLGVCVK